MTYDVVGLGSLASSRVGSLPSDSDGVAAVEYVKGVERNLRLRALGVHEVLTASKGYAIDLDWSLVAPVANDVDGGGVILKVFSQSSGSQGGGVVLNELAEDLGALSGLLVGYAVAGTVIATIVLAWSRWAHFLDRIRLKNRRCWISFVAAGVWSRLGRVGRADFNRSSSCVAIGLIRRQSEGHREKSSRGEYCGETHLEVGLGGDWERFL